MTILAVDDSPPVLRLLEATLQRAGYPDVLCVDSGVKALEALGLGVETAAKRNRIDLVLLDIVMPEMNGLEICRQIKASEKTRDIPVIMVTVLDEVETLKEAFDLGAADYIAKPVRELELVTRIGNILKLKKERDQRLARERDLLELTTQLEVANKQLQQLSVTDDVTLVGNRRAFVKNFKQEWGRCLRESCPLAVVMVEIDCFREYQDALGLQKAEVCLKLVAEVLKVALKRCGDYLARYEGEQFAVFLPKTDAKGAQVVANSMKVSVEAMQVNHPASSVAKYVTLTTGVSCMVPSIHSRGDDLIDLAKNAVAEGRPQGRGVAS